MNMTYPFSAVVGQEPLKLALLLCAIDPKLGGVLVRGPRGVAKTTLARGLEAFVPGPFVELPLGATEERLTGSIELGGALRDGRVAFAEGLLARAHAGVLYVDEVNLLPDGLVDLLLDAAASGVNVIERDGISHKHAARFVLIGTMNPEEGELRPQLTDRFGLAVHATGEIEPVDRVRIVALRLEHDSDPAAFCARYAEEERLLAARVAAAREGLEQIPLDAAALSEVSERCYRAGVEGVRADLAMLRAARAHAAWVGRAAITSADIEAVAELALSHRRTAPGAPGGTGPSGGDPRNGESRGGGEPRGGGDRARGAGGGEGSARGPRAAQHRASTRDGAAAMSGSATGSQVWRAGQPSSGDPALSGRNASSGTPRSPEGDWGARAAIGVPILEPSGSVELRVGPAPGQRARPHAIRTPGRGSHSVRSTSIDWFRTLVASGRAARQTRATGTLLEHAPQRAPEADARRSEERASQAPDAEGRASEARAAQPRAAKVRRSEIVLHYRMRRGAALWIIALDCSASMLRQRALSYAKGLSRALARAARRERASLRLITFGGQAARVHRPTVRGAPLERALVALGAGGGTPLRGALLDALSVSRRQRSTAQQRLFVLTDGRTRAALADLGTVGRALDTLVVDCELGRVRLGGAREIARQLQASYTHLDARPG